MTTNNSISTEEKTNNSLSNKSNKPIENSSKFGSFFWAMAIFFMICTVALGIAYAYKASLNSELINTAPDGNLPRGIPFVAIFGSNPDKNSFTSKDPESEKSYEQFKCPTGQKIAVLSAYSQIYDPWQQCYPQALIFNGTISGLGTGLAGSSAAFGCGPYWVGVNPNTNKIPAGEGPTSVQLNTAVAPSDISTYEKTIEPGNIFADSLNYGKGSTAVTRTISNTKCAFDAGSANTADFYQVGRACWGGTYQCNMNNVTSYIAAKANGKEKWNGNFDNSLAPLPCNILQGITDLPANNPIIADNGISETTLPNFPVKMTSGGLVTLTGIYKCIEPE